MEQDNLKKLKRNELLEIIVRQKKRIEELEKHISDLEHSDDQTIHLSINRIGTWSITLRALAEVFERGERSAAAEVHEAEAMAKEFCPDDAGADAEQNGPDPVQDASFIKLDD